MESGGLSARELRRSGRGVSWEQRKGPGASLAERQPCPGPLSRAAPPGLQTQMPAGPLWGTGSARRRASVSADGGFGSRTRGRRFTEGPGGRVPAEEPWRPGPTAAARDCGLSAGQLHIARETRTPKFQDPIYV